MIHSSQSSSFFRITFVFCDAAELMIKDIFDIVLIRRLMRQQRDNEAKEFETVIRSINKKFWVIEKSNANRTHNCRILLTDERINCYCCLSKINEKFSLLYKNSSSFIYLLISHLLIHRDLSENRDLRLSREFFLLIKLSSFFVVISIWFHQDRIIGKSGSSRTTRGRRGRECPPIRVDSHWFVSVLSWAITFIEQIWLFVIIRQSFNFWYNCQSSCFSYHRFLLCRCRCFSLCLF